MVRLKALGISMASTFKTEDKLSQGDEASDFQISNTFRKRNKKITRKRERARNSKPYIKLLENSRRTARIILISKLQEAIAEDQGLTKQLRDTFSLHLLPNNSDHSPQSASKIGYFSSINYAKVKMCHHQFINCILGNKKFMPYFLKLFQNKGNLLQSNKIRKHKRAVLPQEERKKILERVLSEYERILISLKDACEAQKNSQPVEIIFGNQPEKMNSIEEKTVQTQNCYLRFPYFYAPNLTYNSSEEKEKLTALKAWHFWICQTPFFETSRDFYYSYTN